MHVSDYTFERITHINLTVNCSDLGFETSHEFWANQTTFIAYCEGEKCNSFNDISDTEFDAIELHQAFDVDDMNNSKIYYSLNCFLISLYLFLFLRVFKVTFMMYLF